MHPYVDRTYSVDVGLMPFMGVNDAFQQAYLKYSFRQVVCIYLIIQTTQLVHKLGFPGTGKLPVVPQFR